MVKRQNYSRKREAILREICSTKIHPTAEWVYQRLKPVYPDLSLGTVYRNISRFKEEGLIKSIGVVNGQERFDSTILPHPHFVCVQCSKVLDVDLDEDPLNRNLEHEISRKYGVDAQFHELCFYGTCAECQEKAKKV